MNVFLSMAMLMAPMALLIGFYAFGRRQTRLAAEHAHELDVGRPEELVDR